jgi:Cu/Ag efflux protein CusF
MRKSLVTAALAASFLTTAAFAASITETGAIKLLDATKHQVTLADGKVFQVPAGWKFADYKVGEKVKVTYELQNGKMMASEIIKTT